MSSFLREPSLIGVASGTPEFFRIQNSLIAGRPALRHCYDAWYRKLLDDKIVREAPANATFLELGSGGSLLKARDPRVITSDVSDGIAEMTIDARRLPFPDGSLHAIFMTHVFHHIPDVSAFLREAERTLRPGGVIAMIDVAATPFARLFFSNFHPEPFKPRADWTFQQAHTMYDSNQALSWIVFRRDLARFQREFPTLDLEVTEYLPWLPYLFSGGVTKRNLLPNVLARVAITCDELLPILRPVFALHWFLKIRRRDDAGKRCP